MDSTVQKRKSPRESQNRRLQPSCNSQPDDLSSGENRYLFGPVHSRRLGFSLGIDVVPAKTCTFNCIFCQIGHTTHQTIERKEYVPAAEVMAELKKYLANGGHAEYLTFSGSGEPTLHSKLGEMIAQTKQMTKIPVAVLTCGALLYDSQVRRELALADVVLPSLSAALPATFQAINRPHGLLHLDAISNGLKSFRQEYRGQIWLEVMLVKGLNDNPQEMALLHDAIAQIKPDKVHLNTVVRPPAESETQALSATELRRMQAILGAKVEIIAELPDMAAPALGHLVVHDLMQLLARHPATLEEISESLNCKHEIIWLVLNSLTESGVIEVREHRGKKFYAAGLSH
jgi:wyosine [tRNA(Phe)-imidazoG37] synthetase (radical SAM superfamily)